MSQLLVKSPYSGKELAKLDFANEQELARTLSKGREAFSKWKTSPSWRRAEVLNAVAKDLESNREEFAKIWDVWNAMSPSEQAKSSLVADSAFLQRLDAVPVEQLDALQMTLFGTPADANRLLGMRLSEHAIHTWDIVVMRDPSAEVAPDAIAFMVDHLDQVAARSGATGGVPLEVEITTTDPDRTFRLSVGATVTLHPASADDAGLATSKARMPGSALVRLVYGRLDAEHTPASVEADGIDLGTLRSVFPGF